MGYMDRAQTLEVHLTVRQDPIVELNREVATIFIFFRHPFLVNYQHSELH
jgi:hypothetical protein